MSTILLIACIGMIAGFFSLFGISSMEFTENIFKRMMSKPRSIKDEINGTTKRKKIPILRREIMEVQEILKITGREKKFPMLCALSLLLFAMGGSITIMLGNFFLVPVMAIGFMFLPFWYVRLTQSYIKRDIAAELEAALSIITTAYLRNEDILTAATENMNYLNPPVLSVFKGFISRIKLINPDIIGALQAIAIPIDTLPEIYENIEMIMGKETTYEDMANANEIYYRIKYGVPAPSEGDGFGEWGDWTHSITPEELEQLYHELPEGENGSEIVKLAMTRLGDPYSQERRGQGNYTDCSYLTMWSYRQIGIVIPGTAAEQGKFCVNNNLTVSKEDLVPGDLVFWSHKPNSRFMNITHVGVYAGNGKVIDAAYFKIKGGLYVNNKGDI
ncbi:NlpC/P60 family protein [Hathewaya massiliensis]|uniref:NlpC/P60 family protein n=1 Tax=Hathewaya massiliensis TaxID=1964382 RepID=UPI001FAA481E|nr:NlpC/P60 family protein [Hathewaya massiliensis]